MDLDEYQKLAGETDQYKRDGERGTSISLFGLIGEIGSLLTTFKKRLRDKSAYESFNYDLKEELGDVLWYLANLSRKYGFSLNDIADKNLEKTKSYWGASSLDTEFYELYDDNYEENEQLPRKFSVYFKELYELSDTGFRKVSITVDGIEFGEHLTDNAYKDDGYRFHDCFHFAYAAILGWSPVVRRMLKRKRKSDPVTDEIQDGARASFTEEFIALYVYNYAEKHNYLYGTEHIDSEIIRTIKSLVNDYEVENRAAYEWRIAILKGYFIFRAFRENRGGIVDIDLVHRSISYRKE